MINVIDANHCRSALISANQCVQKLSINPCLQLRKKWHFDFFLGRSVCAAGIRYRLDQESCRRHFQKDETTRFIIKKNWLGECGFSLRSRAKCKTVNIESAGKSCRAVDRCSSQHWSQLSQLGSDCRSLFQLHIHGRYSRIPTIAF